MYDPDAQLTGVPADDPGPVRSRSQVAAPGAKTLALVAVGGALGALTRYSLSLLIPHVSGSFPWATLLTNVIGCLSMGLLMGALAAAESPPPWAQPFLGAGVLGGFTTFSAYAVEADRLAGGGKASLALLYLAATLGAACATVTLGLAAGPRLPGRRRTAAALR